MQSFLNDPITLVLLTSAVILFVTIAYVGILITGNRKVIEQQQRTIDEVKRSEQRYKALFDNSLAGMMKFSYRPWIVFEANQAILDMFNVTTVYELQKRLTEFREETLIKIEHTLAKEGIIDALEVEFMTKGDIKRRFLFSARSEEGGTVAHGVLILMTSEKLIG